jgi:hypothetical protein
MIFKKKKKREEIIDFSDKLPTKEKPTKEKERVQEAEAKTEAQAFGMFDFLDKGMDVGQSNNKGFIEEKILEIYEKLNNIEQEILEIKRILKRHG